MKVTRNNISLELTEEHFKRGHTDKTFYALRVTKSNLTDVLNFFGNDIIVDLLDARIQAILQTRLVTIRGKVKTSDVAKVIKAYIENGLSASKDNRLIKEMSIEDALKTKNYKLLAKIAAYLANHPES